jgi:DNA anti-recombination protein RmuC
MWTNQKQQENALEIARQGALYDKFEGFVGDLIKIGKNRRKQNRIQWCHEQTGRRKEI